MDNSTIKEIRICPRCGKYTTTYSTICPHCKKLILGTEEEYIKHQHFILAKRIIIFFLILSIIFSLILLLFFTPLIDKETETQKINYSSYSQKLEYGTEAYADIAVAFELATLSTRFEDQKMGVNNDILKSVYYYGVTNIMDGPGAIEENDSLIVLEVSTDDYNHFTKQYNSYIENGNAFRVYGKIVRAPSDVNTEPTVKDYISEKGSFAHETIQDFEEWYAEESSGNEEVLNIINSYKILKVDYNLPLEKEVVLSTRLTVGGYAFMISLILIFLLFVTLTIVKNKTNDFIINIQIHSRNTEGL